MFKAYHLGFNQSDIALYQPKIALLCGDPARAKRIAERGREFHVVASKRGLDTYLVKLRCGAWILAATSGMGGPSLAIIVSELVKLGIHTIIRVGTCGSLQPHIKGGDVVISPAAVNYQGAARDIIPVEVPCVADFNVTGVLLKAAQLFQQENIHLGLTASTDTFEEGQGRQDDTLNRCPRPEIFSRIEMCMKLGVLCFEMEAATLFAAGLAYGFRAGCVCGVVAERRSSESILDPNICATAEANAITVAFEGAEQLSS